MIGPLFFKDKILENNVIDFKTFKNKNEEDRIDDLIELVNSASNDFLNTLVVDYGVVIDDVKNAPQIVFFVESLRSLICASMNLEHPFQDDAQEFFDFMEMTVIPTETGYLYHSPSSEEEPPANDVE
jgi:hypothetical protein